MAGWFWREDRQISLKNVFFGKNENQSLKIANFANLKRTKKAHHAGAPFFDLGLGTWDLGCLPSPVLSVLLLPPRHSVGRAKADEQQGATAQGSGGVDGIWPGISVGVAVEDTAVFGQEE